MYEKNKEWSGYKITKSEKGFIISFWCAIQGNTTGDKYLYKFDDTFTSKTDLNMTWNEFHTYGEYLANTIRDQYKSIKEFNNSTNIKCLSKGYKVQ